MATLLEEPEVGSAIQRLGIDRWPIREQIDLAQEILENVADLGSPPHVSEEFKQELLRRVAHGRAHPEESIPWREAYAATMKRLGQ